MKYIAAIALAVTLLAAEKDLAGIWTGTWSGIAGAGDFRIAFTLEGGKLTPDVMFTMGSSEVRTKVTHLAVDGMKIEMRYEFDLNGSRLESTMQGTFSGDVLEGSYSTKTLPDGSTADQGEFKATRYPKKN